MSNEYFVFTSGRLVSGEPAIAEEVNAIFDSVVGGFEKLPGTDELRYGTANYAISVGSPNVYYIPLDASSYIDGMIVSFKACDSNSGACSININYLGFKPLVSIGGSSLVIGDIVKDYIYTARYNSTSGKFELQGLTTGATEDVSIVANNIVNIISIADNIGEITDATNQANIATGAASNALTYSNMASNAADAAALSAANLPNASTAGASKVVVSDSSGSGWVYKTTAEARTFIGADNASNLATGTVPDGVIAATICRSSALTSHTSNVSNPHSVSKAQVGLSNCDNTSDAGKPVSTLTQQALDLKAPLASPTFTGSVTVPTPAEGSNTTLSASTAFVTRALNAGMSIESKTASFNAAAGKMYLVTPGASTTVVATLPTSLFGTIGFRLEDASSSRAIAIDPGTNVIEGLSAGDRITISETKLVVFFQWDGTKWRII